MTRKLVSSGSRYEPIIGFSRAVRVGPFITVAGTGPIGVDGKTAGLGNVYQQARRCFEVIQTAIEEAGGALEDVTRTRIMLTDATTWPEATKAQAEFLKDIRPACTVVGVSAFADPDWLVEIEAECIVASEV